jgi:hypothetical protein
MAHKLEEITGVPVYRCTNINKTNKTKETNKLIKQTNEFRETRNVMEFPLREPFGPASQRTSSLGGDFVTVPHAVGGIGAGEENALPDTWDYAKLDLFDNTRDNHQKQQLTLSLTIKPKNTSKFVKINASLNGPWRNVKRDIDFSIDRERDHYNMIREVRDLYVAEGFTVRANKFYRIDGGLKGQTEFGLAAVLVKRNNHSWFAVLIRGTDTYTFELDTDTEGLSAAQVGAGMIASDERSRARKTRSTIWESGL